MYNFRSKPRLTGPRARGLTLVELLAALTILALVLGIGAPSFSYLLAERRASGEKSGLQDALAVARELARQSGAPSALCASTSGTGCTDTAWHKGYLVFLDLNGNGAVDAGENVALHSPKAAVGVTIEGIEKDGGAAVDEVRFDPEGKLSGTSPIQFTVCSSAVAPYLVAVRRNGQVAGAKSNGVCP